MAPRGRVGGRGTTHAGSQRYSFQRAAVDEQLEREVESAIRGTRETMAQGRSPPLARVCLPDETGSLITGQQQKSAEPFEEHTPPEPQQPHAVLADQASSANLARRIIPARDDLRLLYLNTQGYHVGCSGEVLVVKDRGKKVQGARIREISQLNLLGNIQLTTQAIQALCQENVPIA